MPFYVYILANNEDNKLYKGFTENPENRIREHNTHGTQYTSTKHQWRYVFLTSFETKKEALIFERKIKQWNKASVNNLIRSPLNQLKNILG
jgi:putative endonuclease